jgi:hypothetical protein
MENISVTETKKGAHVTSPSEDDAHLFFDHKGVVHFEFLGQDQAVNQHCYLEILARLHEAVRQRRPELGLMLGSCIMTVSPLMTRSVSRNFWPRNQY